MTKKRKIPVDDYGMHELLDRVYCLGEMLDNLVSNHQCADKYKDDIDAIQDKIQVLYQRIGADHL